MLRLLESPNITSKNYIYNQYDSTVRTNTVVGPGSDAAVVRIKGTDKALAISTDCNGRYVYLNPYLGGLMAVAESARNVVCSGAQPLAITNCLNFGNPNDPEVYWQFREALKGMGDMCRKLDTPVTGGNVSFYNETIDSAVYPTPVIGMVGLIDDLNNVTTLEYKNEGDLIIALGSINSHLGGSEYLKTIHGIVEGPLANLDINTEHKIQQLCYESIKLGIVNSAHDMSDGGLAVNIAESIIFSKNDLGATLDLSRKINDVELLFGECPSVIIVTINKESLYKLAVLSKKFDVHTQTIGTVNDKAKLEINDLVSIDKDKIKNSYLNTLSEIMKESDV